MLTGFGLGGTAPEERAKAAALREGESAKGEDSSEPSSNNIFHTIQGAQIDHDCRQKYVLIQLTFEGEKRMLVRGSRFAAYHVNAAEPCLDQLKGANVAGLAYRVLGGGRIEHSSEAKKIEIYGHSYGFPWRKFSSFVFFPVSAHNFLTCIFNTPTPQRASHNTT